MNIFKESSKLRITDISISDSAFYTVQEKDKESQLVRIEKKKGRTEITCSCQNGTIFINFPALCKHKIKVIAHEYEVHKSERGCKK